MTTLVTTGRASTRTRRKLGTAAWGVVAWTARHGPAASLISTDECATVRPAVASVTPRATGPGCVARR